MRDLWTRIPDDTRAEVDRVAATLERLAGEVAAAVDDYRQVERLVGYAAEVPADLSPSEIASVTEEEDEQLMETSGLLRLLCLAGEIEDAARGCFIHADAGVDIEGDDD